MQKTLIFFLSVLTMFSFTTCNVQINDDDKGDELNDSTIISKITKILPIDQHPTIMKDSFGKADQREVFLYTLTNSNGLKIKITNYGGIITSILVPDKTGRLGDIVLGYDSVEQYIANSPYFGATVGRYANRIAKGRFILNGKSYKLNINNGITLFAIPAQIAEFKVSAQ